MTNDKYQPPDAEVGRYHDGSGEVLSSFESGLKFWRPFFMRLAAVLILLLAPAGPLAAGEVATTPRKPESAGNGKDKAGEKDDRDKKDEKDEKSPRDLVRAVVVSWGEGRLRVYTKALEDLDRILTFVEKWLKAPEEAKDPTEDLPGFRALLGEAESVGYWIMIRFETAGRPADVHRQMLVLLGREKDEIYYSDGRNVVKVYVNDLVLSEKLEKLYKQEFKPRPRKKREKKEEKKKPDDKEADDKKEENKKPKETDEKKPPPPAKGSSRTPTDSGSAKQ